MKRQYKKIIYILFIFVLATTAFYLGIKHNTKKITLPEDTQFPTQNVPDKENNNNTTFKEAIVTRIIDGDTIEVTTDDTVYKVRLIGINCPEYTSKKEFYGKEATAYTEENLMGKTVYLEKDVSQTDRYHRLLRYVWINIPTNFTIEEMKKSLFNAKLLENGYAQVATYPPDVKYVDSFQKIAKGARQNKAGLWNQ